MAKREFGVYINWRMTANAINALPLPIRSYIHRLEDKRDPTGEVRERMILEQQNDDLRLKNAALEAQLKTIRESFGYSESQIA